jgi:mono/diheme cytochrome c family protein
VLVTLLVAGVAAAAGGAAFVASGVYDIAASRPHTPPVQALLKRVQRESVAFHSRNVVVPPLDDARLVQRGLELYREHCVVCHGAPGDARARAGVGLNPNPPPLNDAMRRWHPREIYWITSNGLKMAGMPAFGLGKTSPDLWAMTAFVARMQTLTPAEYRQLIDASDAEQRGEPVPRNVPWVERRDLGWEALEARGDAGRGRRLIGELGCGACHDVPGVSGATGRVAPPLEGWANRQFIAGQRFNAPTELVRWLKSPGSIREGTAMPDVGATDEEAWDMARYLYTLR